MDVWGSNQHVVLIPAATQLCSCADAAAVRVQAREVHAALLYDNTCLNAAGEVIYTEIQCEQILFLVIQFSGIVSFLS